LNRERLIEILEQVRSGALAVEQAGLLFQKLETEELGFANIDHHRALRLGFPEVIYGEGKTADQVLGIFERLSARHDVVLVTRVDSLKAKYVMERAGTMMDYNPLARTLLYSSKETGRR